jgi:hypothetical protein
LECRVSQWGVVTGNVPPSEELIITLGMGYFSRRKKMIHDDYAGDRQVSNVIQR